jgi:hypothetical protein
LAWFGLQPVRSTVIVEIASHRSGRFTFLVLSDLWFRFTKKESFVKVKLTKDVSIGQEDFQAGTILEKCDLGVAASLIGTGWAIEIKDEKKTSQEIKHNGSKNGSSGN